MIDRQLDARNYATAIWRCETKQQYRWRKAKEFVTSLIRSTLFK